MMVLPGYPKDVYFQKLFILETFHSFSWVCQLGSVDLCLRAAPVILKAIKYMHELFAA